jgi:hypothetical protein
MEQAKIHIQNITKTQTPKYTMKEIRMYMNIIVNQNSKNISKRNNTYTSNKTNNSK